MLPVLNLPMRLLFKTKVDKLEGFSIKNRLTVRPSLFNPSALPELEIGVIPIFLGISKKY